MLLNQPEDSWLYVCSVNQMCLCVSVCLCKMALLPDSSGGQRKKAKDRVCSCACVCGCSHVIYELRPVTGALKDGQHCVCCTEARHSYIIHRQTHIVLAADFENTHSFAKGKNVHNREERGETCESHPYHLKCDLKQLIRYDISAILQTLWHTHSLVLPMNNLLIHFQPAMFIHQ